VSVLDSIKGLFQKQVNPAIFGFFALSAMPKMGEKEYLKACRGWSYTCVNAIAQPISEIDVNLERKAKDGWEVEENPALDSIDYLGKDEAMITIEADPTPNTLTLSDQGVWCAVARWLLLV
jgi:hypothetical protein